jgi:hypothetical protein
MASPALTFCVSGVFCTSRSGQETVIWPASVSWSSLVAVAVAVLLYSAQLVADVVAVTWMV